MRTKTKSIITFVAIAIFATSATEGQNDFNLSDINPADVGVQRSSQQPPTQRPEQLPPVRQPPTSNPSIFENDLRGSENQNLPPREPSRQSDYSRQPTPPSPNTSRAAAQASTQELPQISTQNPMQALAPSRLPQIGGSPAPQASRGSFSEPTNRPYEPTNRPYEPTNRPTSEASRYSASTIPSNPPSSRRSILTPTTDKNENSQIIVAAGFENEEQANDTRTSGPSIKRDIKEIIAGYSIANAKQSLPGVPTSLESMLATTDANSRLNMVQQYWETYFDWATLQNRQRHENWLNQLIDARAQTDQLLLQTAKSMAQNETLAAEIQLARSQSMLQEISRSNPNEMLPLPLNDPVTSKYITHYDWYATRQMVPPKLKGINEMLPRTYQLLNQRAATMDQAQQARNQAFNAYKSGQAGMASVLESGRAWQSAMQSMIATVVSYNKAISDYALTITPSQKPVAEIASMLISKPQAISASNLVTPPTQPIVAGDQAQAYGQPRQASATGPNALGPNAGPYRQPAATQQPSLVPSQSQFNGGSSSNQSASEAARGFRNPNQGVRNQPNRNFRRPPATSGAMQNGQSTTGPQSETQGSQNGQPQIRQQQNSPQPQDSNNNGQMFRGGGGGAFGG